MQADVVQVLLHSFDSLKSMLMAIVFEADTGNKSEIIHEVHQLWADIYGYLGIRLGKSTEALRFAATLRLEHRPNRPLGEEDAGILLQDLPRLWYQATLAEQRGLLLAMLEAVYVDHKEAKAVVAIQPKPAFRAVFQVATTREGSGVILIKEPPEADQEAPSPCSWWRRGRVELYHEHGLGMLVLSTTLTTTSYSLATS